MLVDIVSVAGSACLSSQVILEGVQEAILLAAGNVIQSVSISTGNLVGSYRGHKDLVSAMVTLTGANGELLIASGSIDGQINVWNPTTFETISSVAIGKPVVKLLFLPFWIEAVDSTQNTHLSAQENYVIVLSANISDKRSFDVSKISSSELLEGKNVLSEVCTTTSSRVEPLSFDVRLKNSTGGESFKTYYALVTHGKRGLNFHVCAERDTPQVPCYFAVNDPIVAMATSQATGSVAVGHDNGQISVMSNVSDFLRHFWQYGQKKHHLVTTTVQHWHAHPVLSLSYSAEGRLLFSGGEESVLVIWDLNSSTRNFLPRLGAPICCSIPCQSAQRSNRVLVTTTDNVLRLVNVANFEVEWQWQSANIATTATIQQQQQHQHAQSTSSVRRQLSTSSNGSSASSVLTEQQRLQLFRSLQAYRFAEDHAEKSWFAQCAVHPTSGHLLINGNPGSLQEFDYVAGVIRANHPILHHHRVSRKDPGVKMYLPSITRFALDTTGRLLVTIDVKRGEEMPKEYSLKIWEWFPAPVGTANKDNSSQESSKGQYRIVAQLDKPHGDHAITALTITPNRSSVQNNNSSNDLVLAGVTIATGSSDGTVKLWTRKLPSQDPTPVHTNNHNNSSNGSQSSVAQTKKHVQKLLWYCQAAFQYRIAPVLALTFSNDASLLILAHDHLITCWDPVTMQLRASLTLPSPRKVTSLAVLEPRALKEYGQGAGDVYLVAGTGGSVTVFSLLTLDEVWSFTASADQVMHIQAIATAPTEYCAVSPRVDATNHHLLSSVAEEAWIAVAYATSAISTDSSEPSIQHNHVALFSPLSATPLLNEQLSTRITSMAFLRRSASADSSSATAAVHRAMGLAMLSVDSAVWVLQPQTPHSCAFVPGVSTSTTAAVEVKKIASGGLQVAQVKAPKLPVVTLNNIATTNAEVEAGDLSATLSSNPLKKHLQQPQARGTSTVAPAGSELAKKDWLRALLPESTEDLPKISEIAGQYLHTVLAHSNTNSSSNSSSNGASYLRDSAAQQAASDAASSSSSSAAAASATVTKTSKKAMISLGDPDELVRRVAAKWETALGKKRPLEVSSSSSSSAAVAVVTPSKKAKHQQQQQSLDTIVEDPVAAEDEAEGKKNKNKTPKKDKKDKEAVATMDVVEEAPKTPVAAPAVEEVKSGKKSSKKAAAVVEAVVVEAEAPLITTSSTVPKSAAKATRGKKAAALSTVPEDEEILVPANVAVASVDVAAVMTRSTRKRRGSELSDTDDQSVASEVSASSTGTQTRSTRSSSRK